ncbi:gamma-glutamylcyclotransferase family protein [Guptibacillus algicola]|uniref:gamma-glutamylcyclotransferase family protein n=1 Tax=Guptibacillus algicola TaxID=225844 RepID=UPI001CD816E0|nr:gamma-glutamylcyclotransferase family protein [Alkalihalobacillus algicola]MCA0988709.1 gamma-glutamylcyclotransferase [Alkalihalobacillus algicola]
MHIVFVYGTLRKGESNHHVIEGATLLEEYSWTSGALYDTGAGYPAMFGSSEHVVYGEIYEVDDTYLSRIDVLEGFQEGRSANLYDRVIQTVHSKEKTYDAITYIMKTRSSSFGQIDSGDWVIYR